MLSKQPLPKLLDGTIPKHLWPRGLLKIAQCCGDDVALSLWQHYPGVHICIPKKLDAEHSLVAKLGWLNAVKLVEQYSGETLVIAKAYRGQLVIRNFMIRKKRHAGALLSELAIQYDLTERQITTICNAESLIHRSAQVDLFGDDLITEKCDLSPENHQTPTMSRLA